MRKWLILLYIIIIVNFIMTSYEKMPVINGTVDYTSNDGHAVWNVKTLSEILSLYSEEEIKQIKVLMISHTKISKIEGLEKLISLEWLDLSVNKISRIEGLDKLTMLTKLDLSSNQISKIEGLEKLTKLTSLSLGYNNISKIEGLDNLININELSLGGNKIGKLENLNFLKKSKNIEYFMLINWDNPLKSIDKETYELFIKYNLLNERYKSKIGKLGIKEERNINSKNIYFVDKDSYLYFLTGSVEHRDVIDSIKGHWIQVVNNNRQIGWCFDAYLEEIKDNDIKKK